MGFANPADKWEKDMVHKGGKSRLTIYFDHRLNTWWTLVDLEYAKEKYLEWQNGFHSTEMGLIEVIGENPGGRPETIIADYEKVIAVSIGD